MHSVSVILLMLISFVVSEAPPEDFFSGNKIFTALVYKEIAKSNEKNILVSPFSAEVILALTQSGAKGKTGEEIRNSLHLPNTKEDTERAIKSILPKIKGDQYISLHTANKIYVRNGLPIKEHFKNIAEEVYQSEIENINFSQKQEAANTMNQWVEDHTNNKIHELIEPNGIDDSTAAILINALHFKADWLRPFSNLITTTQKFYKTAEDVVQVKMMMGHDRTYKYYKDSELDARFLEIPFKNENVSMVIVLPNQIEGIKSLESQIGKVFAEHDWKEGRFTLELPKFKIKSTIDFKTILSNLGVHKAFQSVEADFSEIAGSKGQMSIDKVQQKTYIDVNESGVEAAAATFVEMILTSASYTNPESFKADHPFIFYIKYGDIILFAGRVSEPHE